MPDFMDMGVGKEGNKMMIAVLSGKGGTGKTLVSVNLAAAANKSIYIDCDVEEPNGHLFFKPVDVQEEEVSVKIPVVNDELCNGCRKCVDFCEFNALSYIKDKLIIFEDICHSCGGCVLLCPEKALTEKDKVIGKIQKGMSGNVHVNTGILKFPINLAYPKHVVFYFSFHLSLHPFFKYLAIIFFKTPSLDYIPPGIQISHNILYNSS